jgi:hypothetical protein
MCLTATVSLSAADSGRGGFAKNENFRILTPRQPIAQQASQYAHDVLQAAEQLRSEIALEWVGEELPDRQGRTIVCIEFASDRDVGLTWAIDDPRRRFHSLTLTTSPELAMGTTLAHEMVHVVLATRYPHPQRLPPWLEEGIAGRYDDEARKWKRQQQIAAFVAARQWPRLSKVLSADRIHGTDRCSYAVATSLTGFLLSRDDNKPKLLAFGHYGGQHGWDIALRKYYGIPNVDALQLLWQQELLNRGRQTLVAER